MRITTLALHDFKGVNGTFELGPLNLIVGPNGSGKTALLQAIQWAIEGRTALGGRLEDTALLAGATGCSVAVTLDDGFGWTRLLTRDNRANKLSESVVIGGTVLSGKAAQTAIASHVGRDGELFAPMFDLRTFLDLSEDKRRDFVLALCAKAGRSIKVSKLVEKIEREFLIAALGEGTVGKQPNAAMLPKLSQAQREAVGVLSGELTAGIKGDMGAALSAAAEVTKRISLDAKRTKDQARQAGLRLADQRAAAQVIAENLDQLEARLAAAHAARTDLQAQAANQEGRASAKRSFECEIELQRSTMQNRAARLTAPFDADRLTTLRTQYAEIMAGLQGYCPSNPKLDEARARLAALANAVTTLAYKDREWTATIRQHETDRRRLLDERAGLEANPWVRVDAILLELGIEISGANAPSFGRLRLLVAAQLAGVSDRLAVIGIEVGRLDADIAEAQTFAAECQAQLQTARADSDQANAEAVALTAAQAERERKHRADQEHVQAMRRELQSLEQAALDRDAWTREAKESQTKLLDAQQKLESLLAEGGFIADAELQQRRAELTSQIETISETIKQKRAAQAVAVELAKCQAAAERDEVLHATAEMFRDAVRVVRESMMVELVEPLLAHMRPFLAAAMGPDCIPYCRLEKPNGQPIFELGWTAGERRVAEPALSGGERALFGAALAYSLVRLADPPLSLLLVEAGEMDDGAKMDTRTALEVNPPLGNVVIATWTLTEWPEPWRVLEMEAACPSS